MNRLTLLVGIVIIFFLATSLWSQTGRRLAIIKPTAPGKMSDAIPITK